MNRFKLLLLSIAFFIGTNVLTAQVLPVQSFKDLDLLEASNGSKDTVKKKTSDTKFVMRKSPLKAVLLSAALPGLGQIYNEAYWKLPLIALIGGYFGYEIVNKNNQFLDYRDQYVASQTPQNSNGDQQILTLRNFYKDQRDKFIFYFGIFYIVNLVDAYVDAHMYDFNVSDKIQLGFQPSKINLKFSF